MNNCEIVRLLGNGSASSLGYNYYSISRSSGNHSPFRVRYDNTILGNLNWRRFAAQSTVNYALTRLD